MTSLPPNRAPRASYPGLHSRRPGALFATALMLGLAGCGAVTGSGGPPEGTPGHVRGYFGAVVADEPRAALVARDVLSGGGTAVDAAVASGFAMAVTLPSRTGLGGGGACLIFNRQRNSTEALLFPANAPAHGGTGAADRPAAVPMLARGLFALHTRNPRRPFNELIAPAEQLARFGTTVSRVLAQDLAAVAGPLLADPGAAAIFANPATGAPVAEGERLVQADLAGTLAALRISGVGDMHVGALARRVEEVSRRAGGPLTVEDLRAAVPAVVQPIQLRLGTDTLSFLPTPADGGLAGAAAFQALQSGAGVDAASQQGLAVSRAWREQGGDPQALLASAPALSGGVPALPASTSLAILDREGNAVSCAFTLNNLFGTGRVLPQLGYLPAAAPNRGRVEPPLLAAAIAHNTNLRAFRYAGTGTGQAAAPIALAQPMAAVLLNRRSPAEAVAAVPEPGRANVISCARYLPGESSQCVPVADPRGAGLAVSGGQ
ncbi:gamma-glutamyltransferase [Teichococcus oryzae]|uniref:Gamma-glutamyltranspeptidase n=1 Tax=Teichococcus oryzae TaxID=1608942 RepID=A0A5B2TKL3_9PROT|nr:gamma-glutamyltransferase [Pseudoroseomonas oryzae]KAA2214555.1 gamma-glutamyltranspeptidase [Pseudoroseomonas oryzae]